MGLSSSLRPASQQDPRRRKTAVISYFHTQSTEYHETQPTRISELTLHFIDGYVFPFSLINPVQEWPLYPFWRLSWDSLETFLGLPWTPLDSLGLSWDFTWIRHHVPTIPGYSIHVYSTTLALLSTPRNITHVRILTHSYIFLHMPT